MLLMYSAGRSAIAQKICSAQRCSTISSKTVARLACSSSNSYSNGSSDSGSSNGGGSRRRFATFTAATALAAAWALSLAACQPEADAVATKNSNSISSEEKERQQILADEYALIVVGGGTAGGTVAYLAATWMQENNIPGKVLLVDRGVAFSAEEGPDPKIDGWHRNWGIFGEAHPTIREDGSDFPFAATDHRGIGGCGSHDTRITFQPVSGTKDRLARLMGWSRLQLDTYYQAALNLMPVTPAIPQQQPERFYTAVVEALSDSSNARPLRRLSGDEHRTHMVRDTIGSSSLAVFADENRWTSAYLISDEVKPTNLVVLANATVDRVEVSESSNASSSDSGSGSDGEQQQLSARGLHVVDTRSGERYLLKLDAHGEIALTSGAFGNVGILQRSGVGPAQQLLAAGVRRVLVDNAAVGHGVDHHEIAVMFEWLHCWDEQSPLTGDSCLPRGGVMGWPFYLVADFLPQHRFLFGEDQQQQRSTFMNAHFGAGFAEPYTEFPSVVCTPNCIQPDLAAGYRCSISSTDPRQPLQVAHAEQTADLRAMAQGVLAAVAMLQTLQQRGVVGKQLLPPFEATAENKDQLVNWIRDNHYTVYHWCCTCKSGLQGAVADEVFRVRSNTISSSDSDSSGSGVIENLRVGSAASLPDMPDANPHLSITAFSVALAERLVEAQAARRERGYCRPTALLKAQRDVQQQRLQGSAARAEEGAAFVLNADGTVTSSECVLPRGDGEEYPPVARVAAEHSRRWTQAHPDDE